MTKLPDKLAAKMQAQVNRYKDDSCWNEADAYSFGFQAGAAEVLAMAERLAEALDELRDLMEGVREGDYRPDSFTCQPAKQALADWETWKGKE